MYIPFASLLGFGALLEPLVIEQPAAETCSLSTGTPYVNPTTGGGSLLDHDSGSGLGEPLNIIISSDSDPWVLADGGFVLYANALGFGKECFGAHLGAPQTANLGDGNGWVNQTLELRDDYGNVDIGTCWESLVGGNHLRLWRQSGPKAHTNALFLAVSEEENVIDGHTIKPNGYNLGRDSFVKSAVGLKKKIHGVKFNTVAERITGLIPAGSNGVNHGIATDGVVVLLTVTISK